MNSHSWTIASVPANSAGPIERAGLTEVPVAGIATKWIAASVRPIASGASAGCSMRSSVTARITITKTAVSTSSSRNAAQAAYAGALVAEEVLAHVALGVEALEALHEQEQHERAEDRADELGDDVEADLAPGQPAADRGADRDRRVEVRAGDPPERVDHHHTARPKVEADGGDVVVAPASPAKTHRAAAEEHEDEGPDAPRR